MTRAAARRRALAFGIAFPLALLALIELGLRCFGPAPAPELRRTVVGHEAWWTREPNLATVLAERPARADRIAAAIPRDPTTYRIVVLGESTAAGFPLYPYLSFGRVVEQVARDAAPARAVEVVNLGKAADSSAHVLAVARELGPLEPDLVVIYTGHNEYQVPYCDELRGEQSGWWRWLTGLRLVRALAATRDSAPRSSAPRPPDGRRIGDEPFLDGVARQRGVDRFERRLRDMVAAVHASGARCVLVTQACNLRDFAPSYSVFSGELDPAARAEFEDRLGELLAADPGATPDLATAQALLREDPGVALAWFAAAQIQERQGAAEAAESYRRALTEDHYPNRARPALNEAVHRVARDLDTVVLVDAEAAMQSWADGAVPGADLFFDHCHPDVDATFRLGGLVFESLRPLLQDDGVFAAPVPVPDLAEPAQVDRLLQGMGLDRAFLATRSLGAARLNLLAYLESPTSAGPLDLAASAYGVALQVDPEQVEALTGMTAVAILRGRSDRALALAEQAVRLDPGCLATLAAMAQATQTLAQAMDAAALRFEEGRLVRATP